MVDDPFSVEADRSSVADDFPKIGGELFPVNDDHLEVDGDGFSIEAARFRVSGPMKMVAAAYLEGICEWG